MVGKLRANIGYEQDGKNDNFERPVLILKKLNKNVLGGSAHQSEKRQTINIIFKLNKVGEDSFVILSQIRLISSKRLSRKNEDDGKRRIWSD